MVVNDFMAATEGSTPNNGKHCASRLNRQYSRKNSRIRVNENLDHNLDRYTIMGLLPGERYIIELGTKTGTVHTRTPIHANLITQPLPPTGPKAVCMTTTNCELQWQYPEGNSCVKGFLIIVHDATDKRVVLEHSVFKTTRNHLVEGLTPGTDYEVILRRYFLNWLCSSCSQVI